MTENRRQSMELLRTHRWLSLAVGLSLLAVFSHISAADAQEFKIIAHNSVTESQLGEQKLRLIYLGKAKKWSNGHKIKLTYLHDSKTLDTFARKVLSKTSFQFVMYWKRMVFTGKGSMPKSFKNEADLISYVRSTPGAIGFVSSDADVHDTKTITIKADSD